MSTFNLQKLIKEQAEEAGVSFRASYTGRGMYNRSCIGLVGTFDECMGVVTAVIQWHREALFAIAMDGGDSDREAAHTKNDEMATAIDKLLNISYDSMGRDQIIYFPDIEQYEEQLPTEEEIDKMTHQQLCRFIEDNEEYNEFGMPGSTMACRALAKTILKNIEEDNG